MKTTKVMLSIALAVVGAWSLQAEQVSYLSPVFDAKGAVTRYETKWAECSKLASATDAHLLYTGWYYVEGTSTVAKTLCIAGDVHIVLKNDSHLAVNTGGGIGGAIQGVLYGRTGLRVEGMNALTIYAQSADDHKGCLTAQGGRFAAGIGSGSSEGVLCGKITINGGKVTATGGIEAAGIGGGDCGDAKNGITINGGVVEATAGEGGAGIGGGYKGCGVDITINGGTVKATSAVGGAGIGGGYNGKGQNVTIRGGKVTASGSVGGAGIGGGNNESGTDITIGGGTVTATGGIEAAGIGGGLCGTCQNVTINGGTVTATGGRDAAGIGSGDLINLLNGRASDITINGGKVKATGGSSGAGIGGGMNSSGREIAVNGGEVEARGGAGGAGIGGGAYSGGYEITINRGKVKATGGESAAGIGGGESYIGRDITINGGKVTATGGKYGAGVGCGGSSSGFCQATGERITINDGEVKATGGELAAGIGGGYHLGVSDVAICGGSVEATGGLCGAGVGCGRLRTVKNITISGGRVTATGGSYGAGIGCGPNGAARNITISGGRITATGKVGGAGIGGGGSCVYDSTYEPGVISHLKIGGGTIRAKSGDLGAYDIGRGGDTYSTTSKRASDFVITGGSILTSGDPAIEITPKNAAGLDVLKTTVTDVTESPAQITCIPNYGVNDLYPDENHELFLYLPQGTYDFKSKYQWYRGDAGTVISPLSKYYGVLVNGIEAGFGSAEGWSCADDVLTLSSATNYTLTGSSAGKRLRVLVTANATVTLDNLKLPLAANESCIVFESGASDARLVLTGDNKVYAQYNNPAVYIVSGAKVALSGDGSLTGGKATGVDSRGVFNLGTLVMKGGTIRNYRTANGDGGGIKNVGTFTMYGGALSGNTAKIGGALCNKGTASLYGGEIRDNEATDRGGFCYCDEGCTTYICGGVFSGNAAPSGNCYYSYLSQQNGRLHGGVFAADPTLQAESAGCLGLQDGAKVSPVGVNCVIGKDVVLRNAQLNGGTYTFNPTNDEYTAAGVEVMANCTMVEHPETTPKTYVIDYSPEFRINGVRLNDGPGAGWSFEKATSRLSLTNAMEYALSGECAAALTVDVTADATVLLTDVRILSGDVGREIFNVTADDVRFSLGGSNEVYTTDGHAAIGVAGGAKLTLGGDGVLVGGRASSADGRCVTVVANGALVMDGGTIANYYTTADGGAVYNSGFFTMNGGTVSGNAAKNGGALYNSGTAAISEGVISNNTASSYGGFCYCDNGCTTCVYGGVFRGNAASEQTYSNLYHGYGRQHNGRLYGGVFATDPTSQAESGDAASGSCLELQDGTAVSTVGQNDIVGKAVTQTDGKLTGGTFYFDPTDGLYASVGVALADKSIVEARGTVPETYRVHVAADFTVNDVQLDEGSGEGWTFARDEEKGYLTLSNAVALAYELKGYSDLPLLIDVISNATVTLNGARILAGAAGREIVNVSADEATIVLKGTNTIYTTDGHAAIGVTSGAKLTVTGEGELVGGRASDANGRAITVRGELVVNGGTIRDYYTTADGGAVYNVGTFTMNAGTVSACEAKGGGALFNGGAAAIFGGTFRDNKAISYGGFCYCHKDCLTYIDGGVFAGNWSAKNAGCDFLCGWYKNPYGRLFGGVFDADPTSQVESSGCLALSGGTAVNLVNGKYIVGRNVTATDDALTGGTYYFDPMDDLYAQAGVMLADEHMVFERMTDPKTYTIVWDRSEFTVNGTDILSGSGAGWRYDIGTGLLTLDAAGEYVLSGELESDDIDLGVTVNAAATVILSNATIRTVSERSPLTVDASGVTVKLVGENMLTAAALDGANGFPAIAVPDGRSVTICRSEETTGDKLVAIGGAEASAIGDEGDVTITSGMIQAQGGIIGNNVTIRGGTVQATGRSGADVDGANVRITGGSVVAGLVMNPKNEDGEPVYCVRVPDVYQQGPVAITNQAYLADTYGQVDLHPVAGALRLWLPSGTYDKFYVGEDAEPYYATVASGPTVAYRKVLALYVNDELVDGGAHEGWNYDGEVLTLDGMTNRYVIAGESMDGAVRIVVENGASCDVTISSVRLGKADLEEGQNLITFGDGSQVNLILDDMMAFKTNDGIAPIRVGDGATVNICGSGTVFAWRIDIDGTGRVTMEDPTTLTFTTRASAEAAASVIKPLANESEFPGINQVAYGDRFIVNAVRGGSGLWTLDYQMSEATSNLIQQTVFSAAALSNLVESIVIGTPSVMITPIPGFYYGMAGATEATEMDADAACPPAWYAGQEGKELTVHGMTFQDAVKAFYQLKATKTP